MKKTEFQDKQQIRLIIVEDQELTRMGFKAMIEGDQEIEVIGEAENGAEAIASALDKRPDVIVMDIGLPGMDGIEAGRKILEAYPEIKLLMLTSHSEENIVLAAFSSGARGYCLKNVNRTRLLAAIKAIAGGDVWLDPEIASIVFASMRYNKTLPTLKTEKRNKIEKTSIGPTNELSDRELEVLQLLVQGLRNSEIAEELCVTVDTVKSHMCKIMDKLSVSDRTQAALTALRQGIVTL